MIVINKDIEISLCFNECNDEHCPTSEYSHRDIKRGARDSLSTLDLEVGRSGKYPSPISQSLGWLLAKLSGV
ncbi:MAG: hypothetical protein ACI87E_001198 [Mariniblastus sp.]|jgi:hypothetical protein